MPVRSKNDQGALEAASNLVNLIKMVETRTDNLLKHLNEGGYSETAERVHAAAVDARASSRRLLGEAKTAGVVVDAETWEKWID